MITKYWLVLLILGSAVPAVCMEEEEEDNKPKGENSSNSNARPTIVYYDQERDLYQPLKLLCKSSTTPVGERGNYLDSCSLGVMIQENVSINAFLDSHISYLEARKKNLRGELVQQFFLFSIQSAVWGIGALYGIERLYSLEAPYFSAQGALCAGLGLTGISFACHRLYSMTTMKSRLTQKIATQLNNIYAVKTWLALGKSGTELPNLQNRWNEMKAAQPGIARIVWVPETSNSSRNFSVLKRLRLWLFGDDLCFI